MEPTHTARLHLELDLEFTDPEAVLDYARSWAKDNSHGDSQTLAAMLEQAAEGPESAVTMMVEPSDIVGSIPGLQAVGATMWVQGDGDGPDHDFTDGGFAVEDFSDQGELDDEADTGDSEESWLEKLFNDGAKLPGMPSPGEGTATAQQAAMLRGAVHWAYETFIDELLNDVAILRESPESLGDTLQLSKLPEERAADYSALFAQQFLAVSFDLGLALASSFKSPSCIAQELAFGLILDQVEELAGMLPNLDLADGWRESLEPNGAAATNPDVAAWFTAHPGHAVNPYALNED